MQEEDLESIVERLRMQHSDDEYVEAKRCGRQLSKDVWESVSAFANTDGGTLLLGLDEENDFHPTKNFSIDKAINQFVDGIGDGNPAGARLTNPPKYHPHRLRFEGKPVLAIEVEQLEADKRPCYITARGVIGGSYKRVDDKDIRLSPTEIYSFDNYLKPSDADKSVVESATEDDLLSDSVDAYLKREQHSKALRGARSKREKMARLNILDNNGGVRLAGLLVFGNYPQQYFPKFVVDVAVHPGVTKSDPSSPTRFLDRTICEGPVGEVVNDAFNAIAKNLRTYSVVKGAGRVDELEIPAEVIREALANAIVHREYSSVFEGESIAVDIYPNRVEITNPGGLWGGKTLETIGDGTSACRNQMLMKLMSNMELPGDSGAPVEGNGSGVPLMKRAMASRALAEPKFEAKIDHFKVVLGRSGTEIADNKAWLSEAVDDDLDSHEQAIALIVRREGRATVASVRQQLGIDSDEVRQAFSLLVKKGLFTWVGDDAVELAQQERWSRDEWREHILSVLDTDHPKSMQEIALAVGRRVENTRPYVSWLVGAGEIVATAPVTSKRRRYLRKSS